MLGVTFPVDQGEPPPVVILFVLPMGWMESPPYFCITTETIANLVNAYAHSTWCLSPHPLEHASQLLPHGTGTSHLTYLHLKDWLPANNQAPCPFHQYPHDDSSTIL